ncbi:hypothetical protein MAR_023934 [Mya arenaria]|uniref:Uncharacterized protein n=1 Tax=Mya arenaria TaxID=6604 RepID=A0ABY7DSI1_MYAAR|nr:hypothetical protein MAR_023934 [Mya arenaria]
MGYFVEESCRWISKQRLIHIDEKYHLLFTYTVRHNYTNDDLYDEYEYDYFNCAYCDTIGRGLLPYMKRYQISSSDTFGDRYTDIYKF